ncbi:hypothetical protein PsorP6_009547 [Peronosclerospora sorghi]|uniref:Uncharacterized protein n=1 Tax=Peronosclerospora sorghi TaxID=230839 RepID=A0ACC0VZ84_9STRA|nr:hypothetical protein PsorP6_009547 [Peronosclerospora sorghi]
MELPVGQEDKQSLQQQKQDASQLQQQQQNYAPSSNYNAPMNVLGASPQISSQQQPPIQQTQHYQQQQQPQQSLYNPQQTQQMSVYNLKLSPTMTYGATSMKERATHLLAACESCFIVTRIPGVDMSFRRIMERKCPRCGGMLVLPQEVMEMLILYGSFVSESVAVSLTLGTMVLHPSLRPDFMAAAMNELLTPLQTDFVYDVAVPKRPEGLGMSLRMNREDSLVFFCMSMRYQLCLTMLTCVCGTEGNLVVGGFIDFENNSESPSVAARIIAVDDVLVAINKKSITSWSFEKSISVLAHAASPVYLTFRRRQAVMLL